MSIDKILSIELIVAGAAYYICSSDLDAGHGTKPILEALNKYCSFQSGDRSLYNEINSVTKFVRSGTILDIISEVLTLE